MTTRLTRFMLRPVPGPTVLPRLGPMLGRRAARGRGSRWRSQEGSRRGPVWGTAAGVGRSRREAGAGHGSDERRRPPRGSRMRPSIHRPPRRRREPGAHPNELPYRSPAPRQSGVARKGDAAGSSRRGRRKALATLAAPRLEHLATSGRRHAYAKPVRLAPVALLGLVRPLDSCLPETRIASGALWAPLGPTGLRREYTKAADHHPSQQPWETSVGRSQRRGCDPGALASLVTGLAHC